MLKLLFISKYLSNCALGRYENTDAVLNLNLNSTLLHSKLSIMQRRGMLVTGGLGKWENIRYC